MRCRRRSVMSGKGRVAIAKQQYAYTGGSDRHSSKRIRWISEAK
jgi:hypothetical protein